MNSKQCKSSSQSSQASVLHGPILHTSAYSQGSASQLYDSTSI